MHNLIELTDVVIRVDRFFLAAFEHKGTIHDVDYSIMAAGLNPTAHPDIMVRAFACYTVRDALFGTLRTGFLRAYSDFLRRRHTLDAFRLPVGAAPRPGGGAAQPGRSG
jgi:hypothetical protein